MKKYLPIAIMSLALLLHLIAPPVFSMTGGIIKGVIYYNGIQNGQIKIVAIGVPPDTDKPFTYATISDAGPFEIKCLDDGIYFVGAFMDIDGNNLPHYTEPIGIFRQPVYIINGNEAANVSFSLKDLPRGTSSFSGNVVYSGDLTGRVHVFAIGLSITPITIAGFTWGGDNTYRLQGLAGGKYLVAAYMDGDGNGLPGFEEPMGVIKQLVSIENGEKKVLEDIFFMDKSDYAGSIEGCISYDGSKSGNSMVICAGLSNTPLKIALADPLTGNYKINNLDQGSYRLFGFLDSDQNTIFSLGEPYSESYLNSIQLDAGTNVSDINLMLQDQGTGSISGNILYDGTQQGLIATIALGLSPTPIKLTLNMAPGEYSLEGLASGFYAVGSLMDCNANFLPEPQEPVGLYTENIVIVKSDQNTPDINIELDESPDAAISGNIVAPEALAGKIYVAAFGFSTTPLKLEKFAEAGSYKIPELGNGKYIVSAFMDLDGNSMLSINEPYAFTDDLVNVLRDTETENIDLILAVDGQIIMAADAGETLTIDKHYALSPNYPNPFNPTTVISYQVPELSQVTINIYNILGSEIITLVDEQIPAGRHQVIWDAKDKNGREVTAGVYICCFKAGSFTEIGKMTLVK